MSREDVEKMQGERENDIIDRVASRTLGGHTHRLPALQQTAVTHLLHIQAICVVASYQLALPCSLPLNIYTAIVTGDRQSLFGEKLQCVSRYIGFLSSACLD